MNDARYASEYWSKYVHKDGSRYIHVISDKIRAGETRNGMLWVDPDGTTRESYMKNWSRSGVLGAAYVEKKVETASVAVPLVRDVKEQVTPVAILKPDIRSQYELVKEVAFKRLIWMRQSDWLDKNATGEQI